MKGAASTQVKQMEAVDYGANRQDLAWQEQMVLQYAPLIKYVASRLSLRLPSHISQDDLIGSGFMGLLDAVQKFDPDKNINFKTYAEFRIRGAMLDELRSLDWVPRSVRKKSNLLGAAYARLEKSLGRPAEAEEVAEAMGLDLKDFYGLLDETKGLSLVSLDTLNPAGGGCHDLNEVELSEILGDERARDAFISVHLAELRETMVRAIDTLHEKEKLLISLYYYEDLTMKEVGQIMGYTESRISQLHTQAMYRLRLKLKEFSGDLLE